MGYSPVTDQLVTDELARPCQRVLQNQPMLEVSTSNSDGSQCRVHGTGEPPVSLAVMMLLRLLITWAHDCPPALEALLAPPGHLPMLLELAQKRYPCNLATGVLIITHSSMASFIAVNTDHLNELSMF